jgi:hypothetical protein
MRSVAVETADVMIDQRKCPSRFPSRPHLAPLKLVAVCADEIFLAVCLAASP